MSRIILSLIVSFVLWHAFGIMASATSVTDTESYRSFCALAAQEEEVFKSFKRNPHYQGVVENVSFLQGSELLEIIQARYPKLLEKWPKFATSDQVGLPYLYEYPELGMLSPTTLRYMKILGELIDLFGDLTDKKIIEVGVGYGGQCKIIADWFSLQDYAMVDLPEPLALSKKYLTCFDVNSVRFISPDATTEEHFDIFISNYAFSECYRDMQADYIQKYILNSKAGYILFNPYRVGTEPKPYDSVELADILCAHGYEVTFFPEEPLTEGRNTLLTWKK